MPAGTPVPVVVLFGPTASGKTALIESLFAPDGALPAEIVSADSMQIYRGMDVGTAKPSRDLLDRIPHHLIDILNPDESFSVGDFVARASELCAQIAERGHVPVVSGGTGFYIQNFVEGLSAAPPADPAIREALRSELAECGLSALRAELESVDPESFNRIHPNDAYRISRALEVWRLTGKPLGFFRANSSDAPVTRPFRFLLLGLRWKRDELYRRIDARTAQLFAAGLEQEVQVLAARGYGRETAGMRAIGYREFFDGEGRIREDIEQVQDLVARNSRHYAKRQETYFSRLSGAVWLDAEQGMKNLFAQAQSLIAAFLQESATT